MRLLAITLMALQAFIMLIDELHFHRRRGLPRWERVGHPLDTASVFGCSVLTLCLEPTRAAWVGYALLATVSCLLVTKDEFVHAERCKPAEHWLHALLFVLHPLLLLAIAALWYERARTVLLAQTLATGLFGLYQSIYWNFVARPDPSSASIAPRAVSPFRQLRE